ncbi:MAG: hypothetical protein HOV79_00345 [Hamadaea sp.]|nr:hypothetical protein [Hamadaea sp.]
MGWKDRQRRLRVAPVAQMIRDEWARLTPEQQEQFLAELAASGPQPAFADPDAPVFSSVVRDHGIPPLHWPTQAEHEAALESIGATTAAGAI